jgi:hypothetical protein
MDEARVNEIKVLKLELELVILRQEVWNTRANLAIAEATLAGLAVQNKQRELDALVGV